MDDEISQALQKARDLQTTPGGVAGWIKNGASSIVASGNLKYDPGAALVTEDTLYDIASVTKSIPLSGLVHLAIQEGKLHLGAKAREILPELKGEYHSLITIGHLLTYTAIWDMPNGLSGHAANGTQAIHQAIFELPLIAIPGEKYHYTNAPAIVLGMIIERIYGKPLDVIAHEKLFEPLAMQHSTFDATSYPDTLVAPTETNKQGDIHKIVHDETARELRKRNIISGNAGMFSTAGDLLRYCAMLLSGGKTVDGKQIFSPDTLKKFEDNYLASIGATASLGWELNQPRFMGKYSNPQMFGKTGFTGCIVIIDRPKQAAMVLLTNAQYPKRHPKRDSVNDLRRSVADIVFC